jgi:hypothetical protein
MDSTITPLVIIVVALFYSVRSYGKLESKAKEAVSTK